MAERPVDLRPARPRETIRGLPETVPGLLKQLADYCPARKPRNSLPENVEVPLSVRHEACLIEGDLFRRGVPWSLAASVSFSLRYSLSRALTCPLNVTSVVL